MTSKVLDLTTIGHALNELCNTFLGDCDWAAVNSQQQEFLSWYLDHCDEIRKLSDLEALASTDHAVLNEFLTARGFDPMFNPFNGIGVASILDMLIEWIHQGTATTISRYEHQGSVDYLHLQTAVDYPAFTIPADGVTVYDAAGYEHPLLRLHTKTRHNFWLMKADKPASGLELNHQAQRLLTDTQLTASSHWTAGVNVPMLEMDVEPDLSWMLGYSAISGLGEYPVEQVFQKFKLRANDKGARVKIVTGMVFARAACGPISTPYTLNDPFIGFFTQPDNDTLPLAAFWADTDVWKNPGGTLEEL